MAKKSKKDVVAVVAETDKEKKKAKKKAKKAAAAAAAAATPTPAVNGSAAEEKKKKKKEKKKKKKEAAAAAAAAAAKEEKKKAKKAAKKKRKAEEALKPNSATPVAEKKQKKQKKQKPALGLTWQSHPDVVAKSHAEVAKYREEHKIHVEDADGGAGTAGDIRPCFEFAHAQYPPKFAPVFATFKAPSPIQAQCWPALFAGRDVIGVAKTGSGKTLGFALPGVIYVLNKTKTRPITKNDPGPIILALAPTRELAMQIETVFASLRAASGLGSVCIYGGGPRYEQVNALRRGVATVVATPGRLLSLINDGECNLGRVSYLIFDEADRMLDMGFEPDIRKICSHVTEVGRQTLLFSATWPEHIRALASEFVNNAFKITIGEEGDELTTNKDVTQIVEVVEAPGKDRRLLELLNKYHATRKNRMIIFVLYKKDVPRVERMLRQKGWYAVGISSDRTQDQRIKAIADFKAGTQPLLIATDVASRGLDIPDVSHVINYSFPLTIEDYVHRIGRTGRGGKTGVAHTFFCKFDKGLSGELQNLLRDNGYSIPPALLAFGSAVKRKQHGMYGAHFRSSSDSNKPMKARVKVKF